MGVHGFIHGFTVYPRFMGVHSFHSFPQFHLQFHGFSWTKTGRELHKLHESFNNAFELQRLSPEVKKNCQAEAGRG